MLLAMPGVGLSLRGRDSISLPLDSSVPSGVAPVGGGAANKRLLKRKDSTAPGPGDPVLKPMHIVRNSCSDQWNQGDSACGMGVVWTCGVEDSEALAIGGRDTQEAGSTGLGLILLRGSRLSGLRFCLEALGAGRREPGKGLPRWILIRSSASSQDFIMPQIAETISLASERAITTFPLVLSVKASLSAVIPSHANSLRA